MRTIVTLAAGTALALTLSACGGGSEEADDTVGTDTAMEQSATGTGDVADGDDMDEGTADETTAEGDDTDEAGDDDDAPAAATPSPTASATPKPTASATVAAVEKPAMFAVCGACHSVEAGDNGIGPSLAGVFNAKAGHVGSFDYSDAMKGSGLTWNEATLNRYLENPQGVVPGTTMSYNGLKNPQQRKAIIDYLKTL